MKSILYASAIVCACACVSVQAMEKEFTTITKYTDPQQDAVEYSDVHVFRDILTQKYPEQLSVTELQKRMLACCLLQECSPAGQNYSETHKDITRKMQSLFAEEPEDTPSEKVNTALMYLFKPAQPVIEGNELITYVDTTQAHITRLATKKTELQRLAQDNDGKISERQGAIKQESTDELVKKLQEALQRKTTLQHGIDLHIIADKILHKRLERAQQNLESNIKSLQKELDGLTSSEDRQKRDQLSKDLHAAKSTLAHSKGKGSFWNDWFGY